VNTEKKNYYEKMNALNRLSKEDSGKKTVQFGLEKPTANFEDELIVFFLMFLQVNLIS
jgi:hypothetical protein